MISTTKAFLPTFKRGSLFDRLKDVQRIPIEKPSAASWQEWKAFIFRNFLIQGYRLQYPIDRIYTIGPILRPRTERELITALYTTTHLGASISSILAALPPSLHSLLGTVAIPSDEGLALAHAIEDGTAVGASDGSVINTFDKLYYGGSAATIQQPHSDTDAFSCYSPSPHSSQLCSLTTELYGFITATILIYIICIAHGLGDGIVTIYIDNREARKRGTAKDDYINVGDYLRADHDISLLLQQLIIASPVTIDYTWVKSHQDELPTGELIHGPFLRPVQLNQYVDTLAGQGRDEANDIIQPKPVFSTTVLQIYSTAGVAIDDWGHYLVNVINGATMRDYYLTRHSFFRPPKVT
jgi:hypothetical protein